MCCADMSPRRGILPRADEGAVMEVRDQAADRAAAIRDAVKQHQDAGLEVSEHLAALLAALPKEKADEDPAEEPEPAKPEAAPEPESKPEPKPEPEPKQEPVKSAKPPPGPASSRAQRK